MDDRTLVELAAAGDENLATTWACMAASAGSDREDDGLAVRMASGLPIAYFNGAFCRRPVAPCDADDVVHAAIDFFGARAVPWLLWTRADADVALSTACARAGLREVGDPPAMVLPDARGRGVGAAATWAAVMAGREMGAEHAILQSSPPGYPVYARMGFVDVGRYEQWEGPPVA